MGQHNGASNGERTPDGDARIAAQALFDGDLRHAMHHIGAALASDPGHREWLALAEKIAAASDAPLALVPLSEEKTWFGDVAVRAW